MNKKKKKFTVRLVDAIKKWYEPIVAKANNLIGKELLKRLPKDTPDNLLNLEDKTTKKDYPEILKIKEKRLTRISTGKYKVGAIYRESRTDKYFLLSNYVESTYVIIKLDDLTRDKEVLSTSSIFYLLDYHQNDLFLFFI